MISFFTEGGPFMLLLLVASIFSATFIIERTWALRIHRIIPPSVAQALTTCRTRDDLPYLQQICNEQSSVLGRLALTATDHLNGPRKENEQAVQTRAKSELLKMERGLVVLEVVVGISPLLGLIGTIYGLMILFSGLGSQAEDAAFLARGISIALNTTLMGLMVAIPSLTAWSYFNRKVQVLSVELESMCEEFLLRFYRLERENMERERIRSVRRGL